MKGSQPMPLKVINVTCGELCTTNRCDSSSINLIHKGTNVFPENIVVDLANFVHTPQSLSERILDLLQLAAYVFCADRLSNRGERSSVYNESWARSFNIHVPVNDIEFWDRPNVKAALNEVLTFMTGDRAYQFSFVKSTRPALEHELAQETLFSTEYLSLDDASNTDVMLFSGGLDSLAGAIERLNLFPKRRLCLVSHKSNNVVTHIQNAILEHLTTKYGDRLLHYGFKCHNKKGAPSKEETQRTRIFLFTAIAFAICNCYEKKEFFIYENGMTSLNFPKQADVFNARASRTTHPKTIGLLQKFYRLFDPSFKIIAPYYNKTKADIMQVFSKYGDEGIISSAVSCSSSRNRPIAMPHCGCCSQCIDRIFAIYAAGLSEYDAAYADDIIHHIPDAETNQRVYNTLRLAAGETIHSANDLLTRYPTETMNAMEYWPTDNPDDALSEIYDLFCRFGDSVMAACKAIQFKHENLTDIPQKPSLLSILNDRVYLQTPIALRVAEIDAILKTSIPQAFQRKRPESEEDFNDKVQAILSSHGNFSREYPVIQFGLTSYRADHGEGNLLIEAKYIRNGTTPSVAIKGITTDIVQVPSDYGIMFVVYDPDRSISDDVQYIAALEQARPLCHVKIYR